MIILAKRIKELRIQKGLTQKGLGDLIGVTKVSICCYESGERLPKLETLKQLAIFLDTTTEYLMGEEQMILREDNSPIYLSSDELKIIELVKLYPKLYQALIQNPENTIKRLSTKV